MSYTVLIPAAGSGKRMGGLTNKLLMPLHNEPVIAHTIRRFEADPNCHAIYIAVKDKERQEFQSRLNFSPKLKGIVTGGAERQDSIYNMLKDMEFSKYVMVHDGARPFVSQAILEALYEAVKIHDAVLCGVAPKDTLKRVSNHQVIETIDRREIVQVHTPQAFTYDILMEAYTNAYRHKLNVTDDAMMVEALGIDIHVVDSDYNNIKITTPEDLIIGEKIIAQMRGI